MFKKLGVFVAAVSLFAVPFVSFASVSLNLSGGTVVVQSGQSYSEPGYSAVSTVDGDITSNVSVSGFSNVVGSHTIFYDVTDSALDSASASRTLIVQGGGEMPFCSGPMAPGWQVGKVGGGCGGKEVVVVAGASGCPWFFVGGCVFKQ